MNQKKTVLMLGGILLLVLGAAAVIYPRLASQATPQDETASQQELQPAPTFSLEDAQGETQDFVSLLDGRPAVVNFWASTCGPCKMEMPHFQAAYESYGEDIQFFMVNVGDAMRGETRENAKSFLEQSAYTFPVYYDLDYSGVMAYALRGFPATFFLDKEGRLVTYANGMISDQTLVYGLSLIAPEIVESPTAK